MLPVLLAVSLAAQFTDVHKRFTLELPEGFRFAPMPGDLEGVTFAATLGGSTAFAVVRIFPARQGATTEQVDREMLTVLQRQPGLRVVREGRCSLGGQAARCRRSVQSFEVDTKQRTKMQEDALFLQGGTVYMLHVEALAEVFGTFETGFGTLRDTLQFSALGPEDPALQGLTSPLVGRWAMRADPSVILHLRADGTFTLAGSAGTFRIQGGAFVMLAHGGTDERFHWTVRGTELVVRSEAHDELIVYDRATKKPQP